MAAARGVSAWGIASLALLLAGWAYRWYTLYLFDHRSLWASWAEVSQICAAVMFASAVSGVVAMWRGSKWWVLTVAPALLWAVGCWLADL